MTITDQKVTIALPAPQILSHEVDPNSLEVFDETTSIFNPITIEDYTGFQADQQGVMEDKAIQGGLLTQPRTRPRPPSAVSSPSAPGGTDSGDHRGRRRISRFPWKK